MRSSHRTILFMIIFTIFTRDYGLLYAFTMQQIDNFKSTEPIAPENDSVLKNSHAGDIRWSKHCKCNKNKVRYFV